MHLRNDVGTRFAPEDAVNRDFVHLQAPTQVLYRRNEVQVLCGMLLVYSRDVPSAICTSLSLLYSPHIVSSSNNFSRFTTTIDNTTRLLAMSHDVDREYVDPVYNHSSPS